MNGSNGWIMKDKSSSLPTDAKKRKEIPVTTGFLDYFPDAIAAVAELSRIGNEQHNPGKPLHWDRSKSGDESDALGRHFLQRGTLDTDGVRHSAKVAWRAMALLQKEMEAESIEPISNQDADGYLAWGGGSNPVDGLMQVRAILRNGDRVCWPAQCFDWTHAPLGTHQHALDIVKYRIEK